MIDQRPLAHLRPRSGWTNDPVGPVYWRGRYHLFHQANPDGGYWYRPHWGHFVSDDLVTWEELPLALTPSPVGPDADGCYSGCVVANGQVARAFYTGAVGPIGLDQQQVTCVATSTDDDLRVWDKHPEPVTLPPPELDLLGFRDPFVWRRGDRWLQLVGSGIAGVGGALFLYSSSDLEDWTYVGPALVGDRDANDPLWTGAMWECPALIYLDGTDVLLLSIHDEETTHHPVLFEGSFDGTVFRPDRGDRMDLGPDFYAPCVLTDATNRTICWGWSWEATSGRAQRQAGWAGVLTLPRLLTRHADSIGVEPLPELTRLRGRRRRVVATPTDDGWRADGGDGDCLEVAVSFPPQSGSVGLRVRCSPDRVEHTTIIHDREAGRLTLERDHASLDPEAHGGVYGGDLELSADEPLELRVYVDRSIVEVYANGRAVLTARVYPARQDSTGLEVIAEDPPPADAVAIWELDSVLPQREATG